MTFTFLEAAVFTYFTTVTYSHKKINEHGSQTGKHYIDAFSQWITGGMLPNAVLIIIEY
jgi:hypothetical protein